jgi:hypothetical protein
MIPYAVRDGEPTQPPDFAFPNVTVRSFLLPAGALELTSLCDTLLNVLPKSQSGFTFTPLAPFVVVAVLHYPEMRAVTPPFNNGFSTQTELLFGFPVVRWDLLFPGVPLLEELVTFGDCSMFYPYLLVDSPWSAFTGREVLGFPKLIARFASPGTGAGFSVTAFTDVLENSNPATQLGERPILTVAPSGSAVPPKGLLANAIWPWGHFSPEAIGVVVPGQQAILAQMTVSTSFSTVQLKQFRDAASGSTAACYQAIVRDVFEVAAAAPADVLPEADITLPDYFSLRIARTLGIPLDGTDTVRSISQLEATFDMICTMVSNLGSIS